jgi:hypothetical protein
MGTGKTILGMAAILHDRASKMAAGKKPGKTLIVAPAGITSDWVKEFAKHTNLKTAVVGTNKARFGQVSKDAQGNVIEDNSTEGISGKKFYKNMADHDHDVHIMSYEHFMRNKDKLANSGLYDNMMIDEVHAFKNKGSNRGKSLAESTNNFDNVWGLSGTPMENDAREMYNLIDTITGGKHTLGTKKEFEERFMKKGKSGKIESVNPLRMEELGKELSNYVQFRGGEDVRYNDGSVVNFPELMKVGYDGKSDKGDANTYYGAKVPSTQYHEDENGKKTPIIDPKDKVYGDWFGEYKKLHDKLLPNDNRVDEALSKDGGVGNVLTAVQKLQQFANAPLSRQMYVPGRKGEDDGGGFEQQTGKKAVNSPYKLHNPETGEGNYVLDKMGMKRYFKSDGKGGYEKNADGSPVTLPPLHHNNPRANQLKAEVHKYLDALDVENAQRPADQKLAPKLLVKSSSTTFGTDVIENVLKEVAMERGLAKADGKGGYDFGIGSFTGDNSEREGIKTAFRGDKRRKDKGGDYLNNQGSMWASTVSPAGKEGVDFGNAHLMIHYDQDWNPQRMAQFTARVRRSDSHQTHSQTNYQRQVDKTGRKDGNVVRVVSLHQPGTVDDYLFKAQDRKIGDIQNVTEGTRTAEKRGNIGETQVSTRSVRGKDSMVQKKATQPPRPKAGKVHTMEDLLKKHGYWAQREQSSLKKVMNGGEDRAKHQERYNYYKKQREGIAAKIKKHPEQQVAAAKALKIVVIG